jgi:hypothetical protein
MGLAVPDLISFLGELQARDVDLFPHQQAINSSTPSGRACSGCWEYSVEVERAMIGDRIMAGLGSRQGGREASGQAEDGSIQYEPYSCRTWIKGAGARRRDC